ncbi:RNA polymerase factor sigma-54 [Bacillus tuaregi]|uniref:RNA polymerase factor sigma-54 n=1 Tax=Bacillus tuaregi TaxID=1816695 RepID=UPI0008F951E6|nr:RNA polymerase factor sigma-54 [Bacillus tuaregi]
MQLGMELNQYQTLKLTLTPELRQSINILQYSSHELIDFIKQQAVENPLLEVKDNHQLDFVTRNDYKTNTYHTCFNTEKDYDPIIQYSDTYITLEKHLLEQIMTHAAITQGQKSILKFLIGHLNQHGYLEIEPSIAAHNLSVSLAEMEEAVSLLQSLDPVGVGARNLRECLLIQTAAQPNCHPLASQMIEHHMEDIAAKRFHKLAKLFQVTVQDIQEAADFIKSLNPRPCSEYYHEMTQYIIPDVMVEKVNEEYLIIVNDSLIPQVRINPLYQSSNLKAAEDYVKKKQHEVTMLMNGISQRKYTLYKVTEVILEMQNDFFQFGMSKLKPMTLKDVSEQLGFHESTISRATSNKYIQTQHGLFKLKDLFSTGLSKRNSIENESSVVIKEKIKELIETENKAKPVSDQMIVQSLMQNGVQISRRTVAKYREEMGIPGSSKRKRY